MAEPEIKVSDYTFDQIEYAIKRVLNPDITNKNDNAIWNQTGDADAITSINQEFSNIKKAFTKADGEAAIISRINVNTTSGQEGESISTVVQQLYDACYDRGYLTPSQGGDVTPGDPSVIKVTEEMKTNKLMEEIGFDVEEDAETGNQQIVQSEDENTLMNKVNKLVDYVYAKRGTGGALEGISAIENKILKKPAAGDDPLNVAYELISIHAEDTNKYFTFEKIPVNFLSKYEFSLEDGGKLYGYWPLKTEDGQNHFGFVDGTTVTNNTIELPNGTNFLSITFYAEQSSLNFSTKSITFEEESYNIRAKFCIGENQIKENNTVGDGLEITETNLANSNFLLQLPTCWIFDYLLPSGSNDYKLQRYSLVNDAPYGFSILNYPATECGTYEFSFNSNSTIVPIAVCFLKTKSDGGYSFVKKQNLDITSTNFFVPIGANAFSISFQGHLEDLETFIEKKVSNTVSLNQQIDNLSKNVANGGSYSNFSIQSVVSGKGANAQAIQLGKKNASTKTIEPSFQSAKINNDCFYSEAQTDPLSSIASLDSVGGKKLTVYESGYYLLSGSIGVDGTSVGTDRIESFITVEDSDLRVKRYNRNDELMDGDSWQEEGKTVDIALRSLYNFLPSGERPLLQSTLACLNKESMSVPLPTKIIKLKKNNILYLKVLGPDMLTVGDPLAQPEITILDNPAQTFLTALRMKTVNTNEKFTFNIVVDQTTPNLWNVPKDMTNYKTWENYSNPGQQVKIIISTPIQGGDYEDEEQEVNFANGKFYHTKISNISPDTIVKYSIQPAGFYKVEGAWTVIENTTLTFPFDIFAYNTFDNQWWSKLLKKTLKIKASQLGSTTENAVITITDVESGLKILEENIIINDLSEKIFADGEKGTANACRVRMIQDPLKQIKIKIISDSCFYEKTFFGDGDETLSEEEVEIDISPATTTT